MTETRQQMLDRLIGENGKKRERPMDKPEPGFVAIKHLVGNVVRLKLDDDGVLGHVTGIMIRQAGVTYWITWGDTRGETAHNDFEIEAVPDTGRSLGV